MISLTLVINVRNLISPHDRKILQIKLTSTFQKNLQPFSAESRTPLASARPPTRAPFQELQLPCKLKITFLRNNLSPGKAKERASIPGIKRSPITSVCRHSPFPPLFLYPRLFFSEFSGGRGGRSGNREIADFS
ncbi:hypothetical protein CEXT_5561 [Caerostris extrusa]|uniref:Uncharacterized protein n=1 Tax=Caerostris extrusa TaxID=172846 RepID=A0AAV4XRY0_CAEEX|nr:hypothetical protein CEXT_5561 [Caerostris extrusa]